MHFGFIVFFISGPYSRPVFSCRIFSPEKRFFCVPYTFIYISFNFSVFLFLFSFSSVIFTAFFLSFLFLFSRKKYIFTSMIPSQLRTSNMNIINSRRFLVVINFFFRSFIILLSLNFMVSKVF